MFNATFLVVGESGSGKDTIVNKLVKDKGIRRIDSYTTRPRRNDEDRHIFETSYYQWILKNPDESIIGYTEFDGHIYWATASQLEQNDVYIIDPDGVRFLRNAYRGKKPVKVIYLNVPAYVRIKRMLKRGDGLRKTIKRFLQDDNKFIGAMQMADYVISDGSIDSMANQLWEYMSKFQEEIK